VATPAHPIQTDFTAGEITERLAARVDLDRYARGAHCIMNGMVQPQGGVARRAGTTFVARSKAAEEAFLQFAFDEDGFQADVELANNTAVRLVPFQFGVTQAYMLEFGHEYIRFYQDRAQIQSSGVAYEHVSPYLAEHLFELRFTQSADILFITHPSYPPAELRRLTADPATFELRVTNFLPPATVELGITPATSTLTLGALTGINVGMTASNPEFLAADVARPITIGAGRAIITSIVSPNAVFTNIVSDFSSLGPHSANTWNIGASPNSQLTPSAAGPLNATITLTLADAGWRAADVGKYVRVNGGVVRILEYTSTTVVTGMVVSELSDADPSPAGSWSLEEVAWSAARGYPGAVALWEGRLWYAGSLAQPDTLWGSVTGDYRNFALGPDDDDAVELTSASGSVDLIRWLVATHRLLIGTMGSEMTLGGDNGPVTPSNASIRPRTSHGSDYVCAPLRVGNASLFVERGATKLREMAFNFEADDYLAPDLAILAEHIVRDGLKELAYVQNPFSTVLGARYDGVLVGMTYERLEKVVAWHHHTTDGVFQSVAVIPNACDQSEVWLAVSRPYTVDSALFQDDTAQADTFDTDATGEGWFTGIEVMDGNLSLDAAFKYEGTPASIFGGFTHLPGKDAVALVLDHLVDNSDEAFQEDAFQEPLALAFDVTVNASGVVELDDAASDVEIGLPFDFKIVSLRPEIGTPAGTAQARRKRWNEIFVRLHCSSGALRINSEDVPMPEIGYSGDLRRVPELGWDRDGRIIIEKPDQFPVTVLGMTGALSVDDGG
jgi:hypothetical protein